jgi:Ca2+-binding EF-hand superfamily protein
MRSTYTYLAFAAALTLVLCAGQGVAQAPAQPDWRESFRAHDRNGDGVIDREEFQQWMVDVFYRRDKDRKGYLAQEDVRGVMNLETFRAANRKADGKLTLREFLNATFKDFEAIDVNNNGALTMEEMENYIRRSGK